MTPFFACSGIWKSFRKGGESRLVLPGVSVAIPRGGVLALIGASGCGKTTLLNILAGFDAPDAGTVTLEGRPCGGPGPDRAVVFQEPALFPWLTALENVEIGLEAAGIPSAARRARALDMLALTGLLDVCHGSTVELGGVNITGLWPDELRKHDIGVVPEDRYKQGLCLDVPVSANLIAGYHGLKPYCNKGVMNRRAITENRDRLVEEYDVRLSTKDPAVGSLSGGNAQKVIIAREFSRRPKVLLVSQPTRGVDIGAIEFIHNQILKMRDASTAVLIISSELSEVTGLSDRVLVMYHGEIVGSFRSDDVSFNELGLYMSGVKRMSSEELSEE